MRTRRSVALLALLVFLWSAPLWQVLAEGKPESGGALAQGKGLGGSPSMKTTKSGGVFRTEGYIDIDRAGPAVAEALTRLDEYRLWALRGLDGKEKIARKYIGLFTDILPLGADGARVTYDVALPWPLGSIGNKADFSVSRGPGPGEMAFDSRSGTIAYRVVRFSFRPEAISDSRTRVHFRIEVEFLWFIDSLLPISLYDEGIGWRAGIVLRNLAEWLEAPLD